MSDVVERFEEAHEHAEGAPRWVSLAAAILAVFAAISGFIGGQRATAASSLKNDAIIATTRSADSYNEYEARSIKQHIYEAAIDAGTSRATATLRVSADHERRAGVPAMAKAKRYERLAAQDDAQAERLLGAHEIIEVATTLFEVSIVLVSITALVGSRLLPAVAAVASLAGLAVLLFGVLR